MSLFSRLVMAAAHNPVSHRLVTGTRAGSALAHRFVAGDTLEQAVAVAGDLNRSGASVSLDLLGEEVSDVATATAALEGYLACLDRISAEGLDGNISIKLTQLGLAVDRGLAAASLDTLARRAAQCGTTVTIDMEDSRYTADTVDLYAQAQAAHGNLGICLQAYLYRTPSDLERLAPLGGHIRLCKGAYVEHPDVAIQDRTQVDLAFARLLEVLMSHQEVRPAIATHDEVLIQLTRRLAEQRANPFEFQMLYGVRTSLQRELVAAGYPLRVYVPYGSQWYPYLTRRLAERPANLAFFLRAVFQRG